MRRPRQLPALVLALVVACGTLACGGVAEVGPGGSAGAAGRSSGGTGAQAGSDAGGSGGQSGGSGGATGGVGGEAGTAGAAGATVAECPGYQPPTVAFGSSNTLCRDDAACGSDAYEVCLMPGSCAPSGVDAGTPPPDCTVDEECPGEVCRHGFMPCSGEYGYCVSVCTEESCPFGSYCETDGHCRALPCDQGFVCPANTRCEPASGAGHGCARLPCTADHDCDCGPCVDGLCNDGFGRCSGPAA